MLKPRRYYRVVRGWLADLLLGSDQFAHAFLVLLRLLQELVLLHVDEDVDSFVLDETSVLSELQDALDSFEREDQRLASLMQHLEQELHKQLYLRKSAAVVCDLLRVIGILVPELTQLAVETRTVHEAMHYELFAPSALHKLSFVEKEGSWSRLFENSGLRGRLYFLDWP